MIIALSVHYVDATYGHQDSMYTWAGDQARPSQRGDDSRSDAPRTIFHSKGFSWDCYFAGLPSLCSRKYYSEAVGPTTRNADSLAPDKLLRPVPRLLITIPYPISVKKYPGHVTRAMGDVARDSRYMRRAARIKPSACRLKSAD